MLPQKRLQMNKNQFEKSDETLSELYDLNWIGPILWEGWDF